MNGGVLKLYDSVKATLRTDHPRMKPENIRKKALDAAQKYAEQKHRQRAFTIAQTELEFAYNRGADQGVRQAQSQGLIGKTTKRWITSGDDAVCSICAALDGTEIEMDDNFDFKGRLLFAGQKMLPPAHPRCACAVEYIEVEPPMFVPEEPAVQDWETQIRQQQAEYEAKFEGQKLDKEVYLEAAAGITEVGYEATAEQVIEMVNSVNTYTGGDFTDILAAQQNFKGRFANYSGIMSETQKAKALQTCCMALGNDHSMCSCKIGCTDNRTQIMGILNIVKKENKRSLSFFSCLFQNIFNGRIFIGSHLRDYTLVRPCFT